MMFTHAALIALVAASAPETPAKSKLEEIRARGVLRVSVKTEGPAAPSAHRDPAHFQKRNFELAIVQRIARDLFGDRDGKKTRIELKTLPREKRIPAVMAGEVDLVISMIAVNEERAKQVDFSEPYYVGGLVLIVANDSKSSTIAELEGKRIAWTTQTANSPLPSLEAALKKRGLRVELVRFETFKQSVEALRARRVEAVAGWNPNIETFLGSAPSEFRRLGGLLSEERYAIAMRKGDSDLLRRVNETLKDMKASGELAKLAAASELAFPGLK